MCIFKPNGKADRSNIDTCELICFFHQTLYSFRARGKWRETVTGDHNKRIRDYMKETPQVKMLDKFSFTLGNFNIFILFKDHAEIKICFCFNSSIIYFQYNRCINNMSQRMAPTESTTTIPDILCCVDVSTTCLEIFWLQGYQIWVISSGLLLLRQFERCNASSILSE